VPRPNGTSHGPIVVAGSEAPASTPSQRRAAKDEVIADDWPRSAADDGLLARPSSDERRASSLVWLLATHDMRPAVLACERAEIDG